MPKICKVGIGSIADKLGISSGDKLVSIDGKPIVDVIDFRFLTHTETLSIRIEKPDGVTRDHIVNKEYHEDLGLEFTLSLMSERLSCSNKCIFCFVDQQPPSLRSSLYYKDDDPRLSFLHGNYVTLTNINMDEVNRLAGYRLSPLKISVHTTDMALRQKMMGNAKAGELFNALEVFDNAGIEMHFQVVLCKGVNDGDHLDHTIKRLLELSCNNIRHREMRNSLAVVPTGLTKHRDGLFPLENFTKDEAADVILQVEGWQKKARKITRSRFVYLADEWYIMAKADLPFYVQYEHFPQLDNGVGSSRLFERQFVQAAKKPRPKHCRKPQSNDSDKAYKEIGIVTGMAAQYLIDSLVNYYNKLHPETHFTVYPIINNFFGETVTVSGLLTGVDIISALKDKAMPRVLFVPENAFKHGEDVMLDGTTLEELNNSLKTSVRIGSSDGSVFYQQLLSIDQDENEEVWIES